MSSIQERLSTRTTRKQFSVILGALGVTGGLILRSPIAGAAGLFSSSWITVGPVSKFKIGKTVKVSLKSHGTVYVRRDSTKKITVLSAACTHLGCTVNWNQQGHDFVCPCHGAVFSSGGAVVSGPAPSRLPRYHARIKGGKVQVNPTPM